MKLSFYQVCNYNIDQDDLIGEEQMYLFSKKIKCSGCGGNYKGIKERDKEKYVCSNYTNYRTCKRYVVDQGKLVYLVHKHIEIQGLQNGYGLPNKKTKKGGEDEVTLDQIKNAVSQILIDPNNQAIEIVYIDSTKTTVTNSRITY